MKAVDLLLRPRYWQEDARRLTFKIERIHNTPDGVPVLKRTRRMPDIEDMSFIKEILHWQLYEFGVEFE